MRIISLDCETFTHSKGNPYDSRNKLCLVGTYDGTEYNIYDIEYSDEPYGSKIEELRSSLDEADLIILFNAKFDLNWLRKYGIDYSNFKIWDCQTAHFILQHQTIPYPSLDGVAEYYKLGQKIDVIKSYWEAGLQTNEIPIGELIDYLKQDIKLTYEIYFKQLEEITTTKPHLLNLIKVTNADTLVLADMEFNGLKYDFTLSQTKAEDLQEQIEVIDRELFSMFPIDGLNWSSNDQFSAVLYGGVLKIPCRERTERILKDGSIKVGERNGFKEITMPRLVEPLNRTECAKEGYWKTGDDILQNLKAKGTAKKLIELITTRSVMEKELNTYALGLPKLYNEKHYTDDIIHGRLNQVVARTGRLSSSEPNLQNASKKILDCFITRFGG